MSLLVLDIDGLRPDVFRIAMQAGRLMNFARLFGGKDLSRAVIVPALAPAPSITFTSQASLFTGAHPAQHGIPGNQFYDRFGRQSDGTPRHYAFDVGDTLAADDAVRVFTEGLASNCLQTSTIYERLNPLGWHSVVVGHMYARGASDWIKPNLLHLAQLTKGRGPLQMSAADFDRKALEAALDCVTQTGMPEVLTLYFMGVDHESHAHGPQTQADYLANVLDPYLGELWDAITDASTGANLPRVILCSDHGQRQVPADDRHSLRLAFPFEREMGHLFDALGLDVHDFPGEDPNCDAVMALNGGLAHVYLQNRREHWADRPEFERDVLPVGKAFWQAHLRGQYAPELEGSLAGVLIRQVEQEGWLARYHALTPRGEIVSLEEWFASQPPELYLDAVNRINNLTGPLTGDLLLLSNDEEGFYFGSPMNGVHGSLHPEDSQATLIFAAPGSEAAEWQTLRADIRAAIGARCQRENGRLASTADLWQGLKALLGITRAE